MFPDLLLGSGIHARRMLGLLPNIQAYLILDLLHSNLSHLAVLKVRRLENR